MEVKQIILFWKTTMETYGSAQIMAYQNSIQNMGHLKTMMLKMGFKVMSLIQEPILKTQMGKCFLVVSMD